MAVRFTNAAGQPYSVTPSLGTQSQVSFSLWFKIAATSAAGQTVLSLDNIAGGGSTLLCLQGAPDGSDMGVYKNTSGANLYTFATAVGTWYFVGFSCNGTAWTQINRSASATSFSSSTGTTNNASFNLAKITIDEIDGGERMNGVIAATKLWVGATLTQAELELESWTHMPQRTANLSAFYPMPKPETADYSGNARTLSGGTGATIIDGPPIAWRSRVPTLIVPSAAAPPTSMPPVPPVRRLQPLLVR